MAGQSQGQSQSFNSMELSITAIPISSGAQETKSYNMNADTLSRIQTPTQCFAHKKEGGVR